jgi:hypothetical protein
VNVDVEGAEADVLRGADALIRRAAPAWWRVAVPEVRPIPHHQ